MCTNRALVNSLECYMDELVDNFEDFVRNSIIIISVAVAFLVGMIAYVLKIITDRSEPASATGSFSTSTRGIQGNTDRIQKHAMLTDNYMTFNAQDERGTSTTNAISAPDQPCYEEKVLRDIGFSCCTKPDCDSRRCSQKVSAPRISIPSLPTDGGKCTSPSDSKTNSKIKKSLDSCCSMCCDNKCEG